VVDHILCGMWPQKLCGGQNPLKSTEVVAWTPHKDARLKRAQKRHERRIISPAPFRFACIGHEHAHRGTLRKFFHAHNCRSEERIQERIEGIYQATSATKDVSVVEAAVMSTRAAMALMATLRSHIAVFERRIAELVATQQSGNESVSVDALYSADIFTDNGGFPGSFLGHLMLSGTANFIYVGRDPSVNALGVFPTILADFDFAGMLNGNTFEVKKDPAHASTGTTSIIQNHPQPACRVRR
jgi:hypothetical protein